LAIGKAALMAELLMKKVQEPEAKLNLQAASYLYRGQELGLRALALFEQAGGQPPAPLGVCHYLIQGNGKMADSKNFLQQIKFNSSDGINTRRKNLLKKNEEWGNILEGLFEEFECHEIQQVN
jgi:hypothetical protein